MNVMVDSYGTGRRRHEVSGVTDLRFLLIQYCGDVAFHPLDIQTIIQGFLFVEALDRGGGGVVRSLYMIGSNWTLYNTLEDKKRTIERKASTEFTGITGKSGENKTVTLI